MKIYATMCVKNEEDVIDNTLRRALLWADRVFVIDNNSSDGTRDLVQAFDDRVVYLANFEGEFREGLKSIPFNWVNSGKNHPRPDWWCVLDADEYYYEDPRRFLDDVPLRYGAVATNTIEFIGLRDGSDPTAPESYTHYIPLDWAETRFFRNGRGLTWSNFRDNGPRGARASYPRRIKMLHFPFRSNEQIEKRISVRQNNTADSGIPWINSNFSDAGAVQDRYFLHRRVANDGNLIFATTARNFLTSPRDRASQIAKQFLALTGLLK